MGTRTCCYCGEPFEDESNEPGIDYCTEECYNADIPDEYKGAY